MAARHPRGTTIAEARSRADAAAIFGMLPASLAEAAPPEHSLFGLPYYSTGAIEGFAQLLALFAFAFALLRHRRLRGWYYLRRVAVTTLLIVAVWEAVWNADVLFTSLRMAYLCHAQGGLQVYRTAEAEGIFGASDIAYWSERGFSYVESRIPFTDDPPRYRRTSLIDGEPHTEESTELKSRFKLAHSIGAPYGYSIRRGGPRIRDIASGEILGEIVVWRVYPGFFDRLWRSVLPGAWRPWTCGDSAPEGVGNYVVHRRIREYPKDHLVNAVLKPKMSN